MKRSMQKDNIKFLMDMTMIERYRAITNYRLGIWQVINPSMSQTVRNNPLLSLSALQILKEIKEVIESDIDSVNLEDINVADIISTYKESELSEFIGREVCLMVLGSLKRDYEGYLKVQKLDSIYPMKVRQKDIEKLSEEIEIIRSKIETLESLNKGLGASQKKKLIELKSEKTSIEETLEFVTKEELNERIYVSVHSYMKNILNGVQENINHLERHIG